MRHTTKALPILAALLFSTSGLFADEPAVSGSPASNVNYVTNDASALQLMELQMELEMRLELEQETLAIDAAEKGQGLAETPRARGSTLLSTLRVQGI